jgi:hypothetical protein
MAFTEKRLAGPVALTSTTMTTVYTCPSSPTTTAILKQMILTNTAVSEAFNVNVYLVPAGFGWSTTNLIFNGLSIPVNETLIVDLSQVMEPGDSVLLYSSTSGVNVTISGVENAGGMVVSGLADGAVTTTKIADSNVTASKLGPDAFLANNQAGAIITMEMM